MAQTGETAVATPGDGPIVLDTIVVTTRRTEEALEDVPGSVVVLDDREIERSNLKNGAETIQRLPNVNFTENSVVGQFEICG
ncbi:MAG: hypothetical protein AAF713_00845 [Pseudomonadota bacterium]